MKPNDVQITEWVYDIRTYKYKNLKFNIYKNKITDDTTYYLSNFNFNITNVNLKSQDIDTALNRAIIILNTKICKLDNALSTLSRLSSKIRRNYIKITPLINKNVIDFSDKINNEY